MSIMSARMVGGRYQLHTVLGRGGTAAVWAGIDTRLDRPVAVKMLDGSGRAEPRPGMDREAHLVARLAHPNIVAMYDVGVEVGVPYLVMELVEGEDLQHRLARGPLDVPQAVAIGAQICAALDTAHRAGVVHRDIKPGNILLTWAGVVKVCDFGIARRPAGQVTSSAATVGTSEYMAPEQATGGQVDARTDLYALGCVLYAMLTGGPPFSGEDPMRVLWQQVHDVPAPLGSDIPPRLDALVMRLLAKVPAGRPDSAGAVRDQLEQLVDRAGGASGPAGTAAAAQLPPPPPQARAAVSTLTQSLPSLTRTMPALPAVEGGAPSRPSWRIGPAGVAAVAVGAAALTALVIALVASGQSIGAATAPKASVTVATSTEPVLAVGSVAAVRAAVQAQLRAGQLSASLAGDLDNRLDSIDRDIARGRTSDAVQLITAFRNRLVDRHQNGSITDTGYSAVLAALNQLAASLPASNAGNSGGGDGGGSGGGDGGGHGHG